MLPDKITVDLKLENGFLEVIIEGSVDSVAEVAEQIGWLGAALRGLDDKNSVAFCVLIIKFH